ncbi:MAG: nuclear transport factor 2 family protein [Actinobacteria bacterium]|nr:nuclear transport factor 2 family protein [Actinomycetota bacterium]
MTGDELSRLRDDVRYLKDRIAILDCVHTHARGHDRHDVELMTSAFHDDGVDEHGFSVNPGPEYGEWANRTHAAAFEQHLHNITTHTCEIDGDVAHCESYVIGSMVGRDGTSVMLMGGRYLDRLERRDGAWRIGTRRCTIEWAMSGDGSMLESGAFKGFVKATWDTSDLSYRRPLQIDDEPAERW